MIDYFSLISSAAAEGEAQQTQPNRRENHQENVDVAQFAKQEYRDENGGDDDESAHCGGAGFLVLPLQSQVSDAFADLFLFQEFNEIFPEKDGDNQRQHESRDRPERNILEDTRSGISLQMQPRE